MKILFWTIHTTFLEYQFNKTIILIFQWQQSFLPGIYIRVKYFKNSGW
jgi:hypothetical protein